MFSQQSGLASNDRMTEWQNDGQLGQWITGTQNILGGGVPVEIIPEQEII